MAQYLAVHKHQPEECGAIFDDLKNASAPLQGVTIYCTCNTGDHGGYVVAEAASPEELLQALPPTMRGSTTVVPVDVLRFL